MDIREFKKSLFDDLKVMPDWVDGKSSIYYIVWNDTMSLINTEILKLITPTILTELTITRIVKNINCYIDMVDEICTREIRMNILSFYSSLFIYIKDRSLEEEMFEVAANITKFTNIYYNITGI